MKRSNRARVQYSSHDFLVRAFRDDKWVSDSSLLPHGWWGTDQPLDLEIGCGVGWHPIRYATENSHRRLIAIEQTRNKFERFKSRLRRHEIMENLLPVHACAMSWCTRHLWPDSVDRCFLLYPNPELKSSNRRWLRSPFMHRLLRMLKPNGELHLATNEEWYRNEACDFADRTWRLSLVIDSQLGRGDTPRTHFEKKYLARGETCFDLVWRKTHNSGRE